MKKIVTIVGARPQFIKAAVVSRAIRDSGYPVEEKIIHTGQHYDDNMSKIFFQELDIPEPHYHLSIGGGKHGENTGRMIEAIEKVLEAEKPDILILYGDTNTTLAGAVAASKLHIPIAHVEAGLRSYNRKMPEEINRVLTDHVSAYLFAPSETAVANLAKEGISGSMVINVGDVMFDATKYYSSLAETKSDIIDQYGLNAKSYYLLTLHRQENTDFPDRLKSIFTGLRHASLPILWPIHPRTKKMLQGLNLQIPESIRLIDPVGYLDMVMFEKNAKAIITDSGGVQKEAYYHGVPSITLRDETEWVELANVGATKVVGADTELIKDAIDSFKDITGLDTQLYGDGTAGNKILEALLNRNENW